MEFGGPHGTGTRLDFPTAFRVSPTHLLFRCSVSLAPTSRLLFPSSSLSSSFSSNTCPSFFTDFLESEDFQNCHPLSLLLSTSSAMFQAQANATNVLPYVLEQTCQVDTDQCKTLMSDLASRIQQKHVCGQDLDDGNAR